MKILEFVIDVAVTSREAIRNLKKLDDASEQSKRDLDSLGNKAKAVGKRVAQGLSIAATALTPLIIESARASILMARDAEEAASKFQAVYQEAANEAAASFENLGNEVGRSGRKLKDYGAGTAAIISGLGATKEEASAASVELTKLAIDAASFSNKSDEQAIRAFQGILVGNTESAKEQFGVVVQQAEIAEKLAESGVKSVKQATAAEKALAILSLVREKLTQQGAVGDAARTKDSNSNRAKTAADKRDDAFVEAGQHLAEFDKQVQIVKGRAADLFLGLSDNAQKAVIAVGLLTAVLGPVATAIQAVAFWRLATAGATTAETGAVVANTGAVATNTAAQKASTGVARVFAFVVGGVTRAFNLLKVALLTNPVVLIALAIAAVAFIIYKNWDKLKPVFEALGESFKELWNTIKPPLEELKNKVVELWEGDAGKALRAVGKFVGGVLGVIFMAAAWLIVTAIKIAIGIITYLVDQVTNVVNLIKAIISGDWAAIWEAAKQLLKQPIESALAILESIFPGISNFFKNIYLTAKTWLSDYFGSVFDEFAARWQALKSGKFSAAFSASDLAPDRKTNLTSNIPKTAGKAVEQFNFAGGRLPGGTVVTNNVFNVFNPDAAARLAESSRRQAQRTKAGK